MLLQRGEADRLASCWTHIWPEKRPAGWPMCTCECSCLDVCVGVCLDDRLYGMGLYVLNVEVSHFKTVYDYFFACELIFLRGASTRSLP